MAAAVGAPLSLLAGRWVGTLAANTVLAALPALIIVAVLPPLVVGAAVRWGSGLGQRLPRVGKAVGVAIGVQVLVLVGAVWLGASARRLGDTALLTLVEAGVLPTAVTLILRRAAQGRAA